MLLDLKKFKLARIVKKDLPVVISRVEGSIKSLSSYQRYKPVANCIRTLNAELKALKYHLKEYDKIEKEKGRIE